MATYDGIALSYSVSSDRTGYFPVNTRTEVRSSITDEKSHGGSHCMQIRNGGTHDVYFGVDGGSQTISVWCWPPTNGKCCLKLMTRGRIVLAEDWSSGSGAWEQLSVTYTMTKGVYLIRIGNYTPPNGDVRAYFDDLG